MEFPELGEQCGVETCQRLDFLPLHCQDCGGCYCKDHSLPSSHGCVAQEERRSKEEEEEEGSEKVCGVIGRHPCQLEGCRGGELTPVLCPHCEGNYCLAHRHQTDHSCRALRPPDNSSKEEAAARIKEITDSMKGKQGTAGRKSEQLAAKVQLMKLKQKSTGEKGIPQEDRLYLLLLLPKSSSSSSSCSLPVFVSRHWSIGRAIDAIATQAKLKNHNNILGASKLRLFHLNTGLILGSSDHCFKDLVEKQALFSGQGVILEYVMEGTQHLKDYSNYRNG